MEDQRSWLGAMYKYSQCPPPGNWVTFGPRKERDKIQHVLGLDLDCNTASTCDGRHDLIRTPFWEFKYSMESLWSLFSYGFGLMSISCLRRPQWSNYYWEVFLSKVLRRLILVRGPCIKSGPIRTCSRVGAWHQDPLVVLLGINKD